MLNINSISTVEQIQSLKDLPAQYCFDIGLYDSSNFGWYDDNKMYEGFPIDEHDIVIDVGCGDAGNLMFCARQGAHLISADIVEEKVNNQEKRLEQTNARKVEGVVGNSDPLGVEDNTATRIICTEVLEHVPSTSQFLNELVRIGKPGAKYLLTVPGANQERLQKRCGAPDEYFQEPNHIRIIEPDQFKEMVEEAGLVVEHQKGFGFFWSIWFTFFWHCKSVGLASDDPLAISWAKTWHMFLLQPNHKPLYDQLNSLCPKSEIIIARKPE